MSSKQHADYLSRNLFC